ncbi:sensor domain-containing diguanylate cyclase [Methylobacterium oryzisoli]|uniref:sensor domain-containing diguanylate cyclase n=1 Tax=Methylobacterium oryzisoli TaxID=3385502 RepID=UPI0038921299
MPRNATPQDQPHRLKQLARVLVGLSAAVTVALCALATGLIMTLRNNAWDHATSTAESLLRSVERTLDRDIELYGLSLQAVTEGLRNPELEGLSPEIRQLVLFDRAASGTGFGSMFVLDAGGQAYIDSQFVVPRRLNAADRTYFQVHEQSSDVGLYIGRPLTSSMSDKVVIPLSRRLAYADDAFAGVVVGTIEVEHFESAFARLTVEPGLAITLLLDDGTPLVRVPAAPPGEGNAAAVARILSEEAGRFTAMAGGTESLQTFMRVGRRPLRISVAYPVAAIDAAWRPKALLMMLTVLVMCGGVAGLTLWLRRELERRREAETAAQAASRELARLAETDGLTGLPNRRRFDAAMASAARRRHPGTALLLLDADQFKRYNDIYGHLAGDHVLKTIARVLQRQVARTGDLACRIGGEEFAVILKDTDEAGTATYAERIRRAIAAKAIPHAGHEGGMVTVSIGAMHAGRLSAEASTDAWFAAADAALYEAKRQGRNHVRVAGAADAAPHRVA